MNQADVLARAQADRRTFRRVSVNAPGKLFNPTSGREMPCLVIEMSAGDALVRADLALRAGEKLVLYVDGLGRFEGAVARVDGFSFGIRFSSTFAKRERTAEQLTVYINRDLVDDKTLRRHERILVSGSVQMVRAIEPGSLCEVTDISLSGLSVRTDVRPPVGEFVLIGPLAARVARHTASGLGLEFVGVSFASADAAQTRLGLK